MGQSPDRRAGRLSGRCDRYGRCRSALASLGGPRPRSTEREGVRASMGHFSITKCVVFDTVAIITATVLTTRMVLNTSPDSQYPTVVTVSVTLLMLRSHECLPHGSRVTRDSTAQTRPHRQVLTILHTPIRCRLNSIAVLQPRAHEAVTT